MMEERRKKVSPEDEIKINECMILFGQGMDELTEISPHNMGQRLPKFGKKFFSTVPLARYLVEKGLLEDFKCSVGRHNFVLADFVP
jgi:hypothetical protein